MVSRQIKHNVCPAQRKDHHQEPVTGPGSLMSESHITTTITGVSGQISVTSRQHGHNEQPQLSVSVWQLSKAQTRALGS